ncbi:MAG: hypothetical protein KG003_13850 [Bacteroidetes bacterium]|nr:hypothetical protein [Bacteroidota bacterium]
MNKHSEITFIKIPQNQIKKLKDDPKFIIIIRLGRFINQLMFCVEAYLNFTDDFSPKGLRQTQNALYFLSGVLYEAFRIIPEIGRIFPISFKKKEPFVRFFKDPYHQYLKDHVLNKWRNGISFHVDSDPISKTLQTLNLPKYTFVSSTSDQWGDLHYALADDIALNFIIGDRHASSEDEIEYYRTCLQLKP